MSLEYQVFDPTPCRFPKPQVPVLPYSFDIAARARRENTLPNSSLAGQGTYFTRGRYALAAAYRRAGLDDKGAILAPAYHCVTMIDPAISMGADIMFYPLSPALSPDMNSLGRLLEGARKPVKVLLATHYFGFVCDFSELKQWCVTRGIRLVEDCSHALVAESYRVKGAGEQGDFIASSPYKFFPCADGGWLNARDAREIDAIETTSFSWLAELRGIKHLLDKGRQAQVAAEDVLHLDQQVVKITKQSIDYGIDLLCTRTGTSSQYDARHEGESALRSSRWLIRHTQVPHLASRRRANYQRWLTAIDAVPGCRPLYPELPEHVVPYMFPLYIEQPALAFYQLKHLGVPVWRWDEMARSDCPVASDYRLHLLHLPCHQSLSDSEMTWLVAALAKVLRSSVTEVIR